jgi:hypothetical protein
MDVDVTMNAIWVHQIHFNNLTINKEFFLSLWKMSGLIFKTCNLYAFLKGWGKFN